MLLCSIFPIKALIAELAVEGPIGRWLGIVIVLLFEMSSVVVPHIAFGCEVLETKKT